MSQGRSLLRSSVTTHTSLVAMGVIAGFAIALMGVLKLGLPIWSLLLPVAVGVYALGVVHKPIAGLLAVIVIFYLPIQFEEASLLQIMGVATTGLMLVWALYQRWHIRLDPILLPLLLIGVLICISFLYARDVSRVSFCLRKWMFNMIFVLLLTNFITRLEILKKVIWIIIAMAVVNAIAGISQSTTATESSYRASGLLGHTGSLGYVISTAFALAFYQFLYGSPRLKWVALGACAALLGGVVATAGRTPAFTVFVVVAATMITERRRSLAVVLVVVLVLCAVPLIPDYFFERMGNLVSDAKGTVALTEQKELSDRGLLNQGAIKIWLSHPILGVGIGNFGHYFVEKEFNPGLQKSNRVPPHNTYLQALAEMGIVGFMIFISLLLYVVARVIQTRRICYGDTLSWKYHGGIQMLTLALLISSITGTHILRTEFWLLLCLAPISYRIAAKDQQAAAAEGNEAKA